MQVCGQTAYIINIAPSTVHDLLKKKKKSLYTLHVLNETRLGWIFSCVAQYTICAREDLEGKVNTRMRLEAGLGLS